MKDDDYDWHWPGVRRWGTVVLGVVIGSVRFVVEFISIMVLYTLAKLIPFAVVVLCLGVFFFMILILSFLLSPLGVSDQMIAVSAAVGIFTSLWILGLRILFGINILTPLINCIKTWTQNQNN